MYEIKGTNFQIWSRSKRAGKKRTRRKPKIAILYMTKKAVTQLKILMTMIKRTEVVIAKSMIGMTITTTTNTTMKTSTTTTMITSQTFATTKPCQSV